MPGVRIFRAGKGEYRVLKVIALIPARSGSKRIPGKNVRVLAGHPLLFYTIAAAKESGIFSGIYVSSDDPRILYMAELRGATPVPRPEEYATDTSPDIEWIDHAMNFIYAPFKGGDGRFIVGGAAHAFAILRPTSPFRSAETITRAWKEFQGKQTCDSIRAVEAGPNVHKLWWLEKDTIKPVAIGFVESCEKWVPMHSAPSQLAPSCYKQNASLEISWVKNVTECYSISGSLIKPFFTQGYEGFDVNTEEDWMLAETLIERKLVTLPEVK